MMEAEGGKERRKVEEGEGGRVRRKKPAIMTGDQPPRRSVRVLRGREGEGEYPTLLVRHDTRGTEFWVLVGHLILGHLFQTGGHSAFTLGVELRK
jgi:hypothetical protein